MSSQKEFETKLPHRPGIVIFAVIGILYGSLLLAFGTLYLLPETKLFFVDILGVQPLRLYMMSFFTFLIGFFFLMSGFALFKRWTWARMFFICTVLIHLIYEMYDLFKTIRYGLEQKFPPLDYTDVIEYPIIFVISCVIFWYFSRPKVREYFLCPPKEKQ